MKQDELLKKRKLQLGEISKKPCLPSETAMHFSPTAAIHFHNLTNRRVSRKKHANK